MPSPVNFDVRCRAPLARALARRALALQKIVREQLQTDRDRGPLVELFESFRCRIPELTRSAFADGYAQLLTFGLLMAGPSGGGPVRIHDERVRRRERLRRLCAGGLLDDLFETALGDDPDGAGTTLGRAVEDLLEVVARTDFPEAPADAGARDPASSGDPVSCLYEPFLHAYDRAQKTKHGIFFTPKPVVSFIVKSLHELLQTEFGLADGLASRDTWGEVAGRLNGLELPAGVQPGDPFVRILDPATGAGAFLLECVEVIERTMKDRWCGELGTEDWQDPQVAARWSEYVPLHLLPRLHGYELMMASWAIAHLALSSRLLRTGYSPPGDVPWSLFPIDALEPAATPHGHRKKPFSVILGNPPYAGISANMSAEARRLVEAYKTIDGEALGERKHWLHDDYVKFFRFAQQVADQTGAGLLGFITNHGYLANPTFRGMRRSLLATYPRITIVDLHGNGHRKRDGAGTSGDQNIFHIRQGVSILLARKSPGPRLLQHADLRGSRESKNQWLCARTVGAVSFRSLHPEEPFYLFVPQDVARRDEYLRGWRLPDIFPIHSAGFITARDRFVTDPDRAALQARIAEFADPELPDEALRARYFKGRGSSLYPEGDTRGWKISLARRRVREDPDGENRIEVCLYRPFDTRFVYWTRGMVDWPRPRVSEHLRSGPNRALLTARSNKSDGVDHFFCTRWICEAKCAESSTQSTVFPLYLYEKATDPDRRRPNLSPDFLKAFSCALGVRTKHPGSLPESVAPEDLFDYLYAIFHSLQYRTRYGAFLRLDFPRLPLPRSLELFGALARLGGRLVRLHLLEADAPDPLGTQYFGPQSAPARVGWTHDGGGTVWIDAEGDQHHRRPGTCGFRPVPEDVWNFHIGGYRVCQRWLQDRKGRTLTEEDVTHYRRIVCGLSETLRIMREIDETIDGHGGWPAAFAMNPQGLTDGAVHAMDSSCHDG